MILHESCRSKIWPLWKKILFRFFFIYIFLYIIPLPLLAEFTGLEFLSDAYYFVMDPMVHFFNDHLFHVRKDLVPMACSGDTSYGWAQLWMFLTLAAAGALFWSIFDRTRKNYERADYILCVCTRYFLAFVAFVYGMIKIVALQMSFPSMSEMAIPVGDLLPMRFSWFFIGYSTPYQVFSGVMECIVGFLLLFRRTATAGTVMAVIVFTNVMMLNLSYDIPVKIFSINIVILSLFLLAHEWHRIHAFFLVNKQAAECNLYSVTYAKKWMRVTRLALKGIFILIAIGGVGFFTFQYWKESNQPRVQSLFGNKIYDVKYLSHNGKETADSLRFSEIIFDSNHRGTFGRTEVPDTAYRGAYGRTYFYYRIDSLNKKVIFQPGRTDSANRYSFDFAQPDTSGYLLTGIMRNDSVRLFIKPSKHKFQLAEKQFHWLSEGNR